MGTKCAREAKPHIEMLGSVWLRDKVGWDGSVSGSWDGMSLFSIFIRDETNLFSVWLAGLSR